MRRNRQHVVSLRIRRAQDQAVLFRLTGAIDLRKLIPRHPPPSDSASPCVKMGPMHSGGTARALRAALFALVCVGTGTELHRLANGSDPSWVGPGLALPIVWLAAYGLAR